LKNKNYTILIATEQSSSSRSLQISRYALILFLFFEILAVGLGIYGFMVLSSLDKRASELNSLRKYSYYLTEVLNNSEFKSAMPDSLISTNPIIKQIGSKNQVEFYNSILNNLVNNPDRSEPVENFINSLELYQDSVPNKIPVHGYVNNSINIDDMHYGIDIGATMGEDIVAAGRGIVVAVVEEGGENNDLGNYITISHANGFFTVYGHNDTNLVSIRDVVEAGQVIAKVGKSGLATGPHLHFEMWQNNKILDPTEVIKYYKGQKIY